MVRRIIRILTFVSLAVLAVAACAVELVENPIPFLGLIFEKPVRALLSALGPIILVATVLALVAAWISRFTKTDKPPNSN